MWTQGRCPYNVQVIWLHSNQVFALCVNFYSMSVVAVVAGRGVGFAALAQSGISKSLYRTYKEVVC